MKKVFGSDGYPSRGLEGIIEGVLNDIETWAMDFNAPRVHWLNGLPGPGKTIVAATFISHMGDPECFRCVYILRGILLLSTGPGSEEPPPDIPHTRSQACPEVPQISTEIGPGDQVKLRRHRGVPDEPVGQMDRQTPRAIIQSKDGNCHRQFRRMLSLGSAQPRYQTSNSSLPAETLQEG